MSSQAHPIIMLTGRINIYVHCVEHFYGRMFSFSADGIGLFSKDFLLELQKGKLLTIHDMEAQVLLKWQVKITVNQNNVKDGSFQISS